MKKVLVLLLVVGLTFSLVACTSDGGEEVDTSDYPSKNIEIIVAYKAGGGTDVGARILASEAEKEIGQPLVIINREGSDGELGYTQLAQAKPDGYTIGFINLPTFVSLTLERDTKYGIDDVEPILNHVYDSGVVVVQSSSELDTIEDFIEYAKKNPGDLTIANNGTGASNHIGAAHLAHEADIEVTHVPFGGSTDMLAALRGGHVKAAVAKISEVAGLVDSGELKILASFTEERLENFPDVPTLAEKGYKILFGSARALVAPKGTPKEIIDYLHDKFKAAMESTEHMEKAKNADLPIMYMGPEELGEYIKNEEVYLKEIGEILDLTN
ncbi:MAG TPA: tripartite tricarboxylate transporter substrate binding protein [Tissierellaceae bacterium]|nr:tripartite tricarboxylate transporter substrate binding protein [Tissierellaceae bacterium]